MVVELLSIDIIQGPMFLNHAVLTSPICPPSIKYANNYVKTLFDDIHGFSKGSRKAQIDLVHI